MAATDVYLLGFPLWGWAVALPGPVLFVVLIVNYVRDRPRLMAVQARREAEEQEFPHRN